MTISCSLKIQEIDVNGVNQLTFPDVFQSRRLMVNGCLRSPQKHQGDQGPKSCHRHGEEALSHQIDVMTAGMGWYLANNQQLSLKPGDMIWSLGKSRPRLLKLADNSTVIRITVPMIKALELRLSRSFELDLFCSQVSRLSMADDHELGQFRRLISDVKSRDRVIVEIAQEELKLHLRRLSQHAVSDIAVRSDVIRDSTCRQVYNMLLYMSAHHRENLTVDNIASHVGLHRNFAMNIFRKVIGQSLVQFLTCLRIRYAENMLLTTSESVTTIAFASGFSSITRFYEVFGKYFGDSPQRYRKRCWNKSL